ncbi:hypothetical protein MHK_002518 [Candidatus Magnetomorum sp. HK-1]|nr:hypothetical protein MHK_002518 [Candidatus Magnetomorum sp. HK-1]
MTKKNILNNDFIVEVSDLDQRSSQIPENELKQIFGGKKKTDDDLTTDPIVLMSTVYNTSKRPKTR